jgi:hypothetical protein
MEDLTTDLNDIFERRKNKMKKMFIVFLGILLIVGLSLISCQQKEKVTKEKADTETTGYGEKAGETVEKAKEAVAGYGEKAEKTVEKAQETVSGYEEKAEKEVENVEKALEGFGK